MAERQNKSGSDHSSEARNKTNPQPQTNNMGLSDEPGSLFQTNGVGNVLRLQRTIGNQATQRLLMRRAGATTPDAAAPEMTGLDVTGSYEALDPGGSNRITIQINQAGHHLEGWQQRRVYRSHTNSVQHQRLEQSRITADLIEDGAPNTYRYRRVNSVGREVSSGTMTFTQSASGARLQMLSESGWTHAFERTATTSRASDEAIEAAPEEMRGVIEASINAPLDRDEEERLGRSCERIKTIIRDYLDESGIGRTGKAATLNSYIEDLMVQFANEQLPLVVRRMREILTSESTASGSVTRPYWDWIQIVVMEQPTYTEHIQQRLGMQPGGDPLGQHRYRWMFSTVGVSGDVLVGGGVFGGVFIIEKLEPDRWTQQYAVGMAGFSGGLSAGVTVGQTTAWSEFESPFPWTSGNFRGWFALTGATGSGSLVGGGGYSPTAMITFYGDGSFEPLAADASGFMVEYGVHAGLELGVSTGYLAGGHDEVLQHVHPPQDDSADSDYRSGESVHFPVDDPSLNDTGLQAVRQMCALQRRGFESEASTLRIDGYTSTTGTDARNQQLSDLRAQNTLQAIRDVLGDNLRIPDEQITIQGHGEGAAREAGEADDVENEAWRKVEISLNGQVILTLR